MIYLAWAILIFCVGFLTGSWLTEFLVKAEFENERRSRILAFFGCGRKEKL